MRTIAIVVPVYNSAADVERCLASLARHRPEGSTILLVDDASTDASVLPMLRAFESAHPDVQVIAAEKNRGFLVTANRGAAAAPAEADILFLNTDTEVTEGWARELGAALEANPAAAVACPLSNNATIPSGPRFPPDN